MSLKPQKTGILHRCNEATHDEEEKEFEQPVRILDEICNPLRKEIIAGVLMNIIESVELIEQKQCMDDTVTDYASFSANDLKYKVKKRNCQHHNTRSWC